jgi:hypothetical protein
MLWKLIDVGTKRPDQRNRKFAWFPKRVWMDNDRKIKGMCWLECYEERWVYNSFMYSRYQLEGLYIMPRYLPQHNIATQK